MSVRWVAFALFLAVFSCPCAPDAVAQTPSLLPAKPPPPPPAQPPPPNPGSAAPIQQLPDAPSTSMQQDVLSLARSAFEATGDPLPNPASPLQSQDQVQAQGSWFQGIKQKRAAILYDQRFLNEEVSLPVSSRQKAFLAATDVSDVGNLLVIAASSAIYTAANSHSAYGPGVLGFGRNFGYSLSQDATSEFFGTYLIPSVARQDPRYHRMPGAPTGKRILHALSHTLVTQHDNGSPMPNYATLLTYPVAAEIANLYVPGLQTDSRSTAKRIIIGYASDPADALIGEFLPDVARRIHIRVTFFQQIINDISTEHPM